MQINDSQKVTIKVVNVKDVLGNPAKLKQVPVWGADPIILTLTVAEDGLSATGAAVATGSATVTVTADGITRTATIDVVAGDAISFDLEVTIDE